MSTRSQSGSRAIEKNARPMQRARTAWITPLVLCAAPFIGVLLLRAPLLNQLAYLDASFYTGYGWGLDHHLEVFEATYYSVRFPPILLIAGSSTVFGPVAGYLILRWLIIAGTCWALYRCTRLFASRRVALGAALLLALNPWFLRLVLWDYGTFVALPATIVAVAVWPRGPGQRHLGAAALAGALVVAAAFANPLAVAVVPALAVVEVVAVLREGRAELRPFVLRCGAALTGGVALFLAGWLAYAAVLGPFDPYDLLRPTVDFARNQDTLAAGYVVPVRDWILDEPRIYAPLVLIAGMALAMGRRLLGTDVAARVAQFAVLYPAVLWAYRFVSTSANIETWWANGMQAASMAFAGAVLLHEVDRRGFARLRVVAAPIAVAALVGLAVRSSDVRAVELYEHARGHAVRLGAIIVISLLVGLAVRRTQASARAAGAAVILAVATWLALTPAKWIASGHTGEFSNAPVDELRGYAAAHRLEQLVNEGDTPNARRLVWYPAATGLLRDVWVTLPNAGGSVNPYDVAAPEMAISEYAEARLRYPTTASVVVFAEDSRRLEIARRNLSRKAISYQAEPPRSWAGGRVRAQVLHLRNRRPGGNVAAVKTSAQGFLDAAKAQDAVRACRFLLVDLVLSLAARHGSCPAGVADALRREPLGDAPAGISIERDTAHVTVAGTGRVLVFLRVRSQWQLRDAP
jgi:hypothetical protein